MRVRRALHTLIDRVLPADAAVWFMTGGTGATLMMGAVTELGVVDELAEGKASADEIAGRLGLDADALHRVLRALAVHGVVRLDRHGRFALTRIGSTLRSDHPQSMSTWVRYMSLPSTQDAWRGIGGTLRTGDPAFSAVHGRTVWEHYAAVPEEERLFAATMRALTRPAIGRDHRWLRLAGTGDRVRRGGWNRDVAGGSARGEAAAARGARRLTERPGRGGGGAVGCRCRRAH